MNSVINTIKQMHFMGQKAQPDSLSNYFEKFCMYHPVTLMYTHTPYNTFVNK